MADTQTMVTNFGATIWDTEPPKSIPVQFVYIEPFDARGMSRVYGRGDRFGAKASFNMDIWLERKSRIFVRFWSRNSEVDNLSFELSGIPIDTIPDRKSNSGFTESWIPKIVRDEYVDWIISEC